MKTDPPTDRERLRAHIIALTMACPFDQGNPADCPLCSVRQKPVKERLIWVDSLSDSETARIARHHRLCLEAKEKR
jgi:hypothetical protein